MSVHVLVRCFLPLLCTISLGCAGTNPHQQAVRAWQTGDHQAARQFLTDAEQERGAEQHRLQLDQAVAALVMGDARSAQELLSASRQRLRYLEEKDAVEQAASFVRDETSVEWTADSYERTLVDAFLLLTSAFGPAEDRFAFGLQARERAVADMGPLLPPSATGSAEIQTVAAEREHPDEVVQAADRSLPFSDEWRAHAAALWLDAAFLAEMHRDYDVIERSQQRLSRLIDEPVSVLNPDRVHSSPGHGVVHVISLVGMAPQWVEERAEATSQALLIADRILSATGKHSLPPTLSAVKIARPVNVRSEPNLRVTLSAGADPKLDSAIPSRTLVDTFSLAHAEYKSHRDRQLARAVVRRVIKKSAVVAAKEHLDVDRSGITDFAVNAAGVLWEASEKADTRSWQLLPEQIQVASIELPEGEHLLSTAITRSSDPRRDVLDSESFRVSVVNGRNTWVLCLVQQSQFTRPALVGTP